MEIKFGIEDAKQLRNPYDFVESVLRIQIFYDSASNVPTGVEIFTNSYRGCKNA